MRYYVFTIQYNKIAQAENRTVPKAFDTLNDAIAEWHGQLKKDHDNKTLGWSLAMIINSDGMAVPGYTEKYISDEPTPEVLEATEEIVLEK